MSLSTNFTIVTCEIPNYNEVLQSLIPWVCVCDLRVIYPNTVQDAFSVILFNEILLVFGVNYVFMNSKPSVMINV